MKYFLPQPNSINGEQLAAEINAATGLQLTMHDVGFEPPLTVETLGDYPEHQEAIAAVVAAHIPAV